MLLGAGMLIWDTPYSQCNACATATSNCEEMACTDFRGWGGGPEKVWKVDQKNPEPTECDGWEKGQRYLRELEEKQESVRPEPPEGLVFGQVSSYAAEDGEVCIGVPMLPLQPKKKGDPKLTPMELYVRCLRPWAAEPIR